MSSPAATNPLHNPRYPRSNTYDPEWVFENQMGPNALWLMESLTEVLPIEPGMRVLDLGCGRAMTSIFLAREFGARVWATDLGSTHRRTSNASARQASRTSSHPSTQKPTSCRSPTTSSTRS